MDKLIERLRQALLSAAFFHTQPDRGDVFDWLDDNLGKLLAERVVQDALAAQAAQIERLTADLATARADALEEAVKVARACRRYRQRHSSLIWNAACDTVSTALNNLKDRTDAD